MDVPLVVFFWDAYSDMQPTTVALGAGAALGVAFLMSRATGEGEEVVVEDFGKRVSDYGPEVDPQPSAPPEPSAPPMTGTTLDEWRAENEKNANPTAVIDPASKVEINPQPNPPINGRQEWSTLQYAMAGGAVIGGAALLGAGGYAANEYRTKDQAYVSPDGPTNTLALEEGRPE